MYKKVLLFASIFVLAALLLTACGQGTTEPPAVEEPSTEVEEPEAEPVTGDRPFLVWAARRGETSGTTAGF